MEKIIIGDFVIGETWVSYGEECRPQRNFVGLIMDYDRSEMFGYVFLVNNMWVPIFYCKKIGPPLLKSKDGFNVWIGDTVYGVENTSGDIAYFTKTPDVTSAWDEYFVSEEAAYKYSNFIHELNSLNLEDRACVNLSKKSVYPYYIVSINLFGDPSILTVNNATDFSIYAISKPWLDKKFHLLCNAEKYVRELGGVCSAQTYPTLADYLFGSKFYDPDDHRIYKDLHEGIWFEPPHKSPKYIFGAYPYGVHKPINRLRNSYIEYAHNVLFGEKILTTEDGIDFFRSNQGDLVYSCHKNMDSFVAISVSGAALDVRYVDWLHFSTIAARSEYIYKNKPRFSIKDLEGLWVEEGPTKSSLLLHLISK